MKISKTIVTIIGIVLFLFPIAYLLILSFATDWTFPALLPKMYTINTWQLALSNANGVLQALLLSLSIAFSIAFVATLLGFFISKAIVKHKRKNLLLFACYFPLVLSPVVYALLINHFFVALSLSGTLLGVVIAQLFITLPYSILLLVSFWSYHIDALEAMSYTLGANAKQTFFKVLLPVAKPMLLVCFFQTFLISWFEYGLTTIIGIGKVQTLTLKLYQYIGEANVYFAAVSSCMIVLPIIILVFINKKFIYTKLV